MLIAVKLLVNRIIPARSGELASKIGKAVSAGFSLADIQKKIVDPANIKKVMPVVEDHVDDFLRNKLKEKIPMIGMLIGEKTVNNLKEVFLKEIEELFPQVLTRFSSNLSEQLDVEKMVTDKITSVSAQQWGKILSPALKYFQIAGAIAGLIIGLVDWLIIMIVK